MEQLPGWFVRFIWVSRVTKNTAIAFCLRDFEIFTIFVRRLPVHLPTHKLHGVSKNPENPLLNRGAITDRERCSRPISHNLEHSLLLPLLLKDFVRTLSVVSCITPCTGITAIRKLMLFGQERALTIMWARSVFP